MSPFYSKAYIYKDGNLVFKDNFLLDAVFINSKTQNLSDNVYIFPGFVDVHVHFREPGFSFKETIRTGSLAAANGGGF